ncbi:MAG TPA: FRG domain-containing protein [Fimbriimonadaceae bacterium]|nr:FRG domain-containing protein [Fimbriimonadaceae bacterium]
MSYQVEWDTPKSTTNNRIRAGRAHRVDSFLELARKIAALQYKNPQYVLLFRGQAKDYKNQKGNSSLKPCLLRPRKGSSELPGRELLLQRFQFLAEAERRLVEGYESVSDIEGVLKIKRQRILRWAILQHYEIAFTPLLDVSQSLRVAASFASATAEERAFIYVLGVPNLSGAISASAEAGLQIVRLSGVCPPVALRPHIQEGYLLGEYPDMPDIEQKQHYPAFETDFGRRLLAKLEFDPRTFWSDAEFPMITRGALYPDRHDPLFVLAQELRDRIGSQE